MIRLHGIEKVYRTDRIETVALSECRLEVGEQASSSRSWGPLAAARARCSTSSGLLDAPTRGGVTLNGAPVRS